MVVTYKRLYNYKFDVEVSGGEKLVYDLRAPSKDNATLYNKMNGYLSSKSYELIK